jgi:hypothetical protein
MYGGSRGIAPLILQLAIRWRRGVSFTPQLFYTRGKDFWYKLILSLGGPQGRSEYFGKRNIYTYRETNPGQFSRVRIK